MTEHQTLQQRHAAYVAQVQAGVDPASLSEEQAWHHRRSTGIGGSEAGTILGLNQYQDAYDLWLIKTGRKEAPDLSDNMAVKMGHKLEGIVADLYAEATGHRVVIDETHYRHKDMPWLVGNVDRLVEGERRILECKTASGFAAKKNGFGPGNVYGLNGEVLEICDQVPESYLIQVQHYMNVLDYPVADLAVLIDGRDFRIYTIERDDELIDAMNAQITAFWFDSVIGGNPPATTAPPPPPEANPDSPIEADGTMLELLQARAELTAAIDELKAEQATVDDQLKAFMGSHDTLTCAGTTLATWKAQTSNRFDSTAFKKAHPDLFHQFTKQSESRVFRIAKEKAQ